MMDQDDRVFAAGSSYSFQKGVDLRTWMATQFMASRLPLWCENTRLDREYADLCAEEALIATDALIAALNKPKNDKP